MTEQEKAFEDYSKGSPPYVTGEDINDARIAAVS